MMKLMDGCPTARNFQTENIKFARSFKDHQGSLIPNPPSCIAKYICFNDFWLVYAPIGGKQNEEFNRNKHQKGNLDEINEKRIWLWINNDQYL